MQVIFVDDERRVLTAVERALMVLDRDWECRFANSAQEALAMLAERPADVVVSDMRMPFMDGAELLQRVREQWPATIRIILSGQSDSDATLRMLDVAHQFVAKPCDNAVLLGAVESAVDLRSLLQDSSVVDLVGRISRLPAAPTVFMELCKLIADPGSDSRHISKLLGSDPALSAKILQLANSAYFAGHSSIHDVGNAISRLGLDSVRLLVLASQVFANGAGDPAIDDLQHRALLASRLAVRIAGRAGPSSTGALLAHVGLTIAEIRNADHPEPTTRCDTPAHAAVGAYLLGLWGLPLDIVDAVARHHQPGRSVPAGFGTAGVVHVATALANQEEPDLDYLEQVGVLDHWPEWQAVCESTEEQSDE